MKIYQNRSKKMETAALALGIISITTCSCLYISILCGALAILFALLSKGGACTMSSRAVLSLWLGIIGIAVTVLFFGVALGSSIATYGSLENALRAACEMYGYDYEELFPPLLLLF